MTIHSARVSAVTSALKAGYDADEVLHIFECIELVLTVLSALRVAGEPKLDTKFLSLLLLVGYYFEVSHDLPEYRIEGKYVA